MAATAVTSPEIHSMQAPRIAAIICPNGLGHLRRAVGILSRLIQRRPEVEFDLICSRWQLDKLAGWDRLQGLVQSGAGLHTGWTEPGVRWSTDPNLYTDGRLTRWIERLANQQVLETADLVLSDNLAAVLELRPDAVLSGSFLWSDVLGQAYPESAAVESFRHREETLLRRHRPPMLCLRDLAMPAVMEQTEAVPLAWMCEDTRRSVEDRFPKGGAGNRTSAPTIAVAGGATGAATKILASLVEDLATEGYRLLAPEALVPKATTARSSEPAGPVETFEPRRLAEARILICRPGAGTLNDAIAHRVPMITLYEAGNPEMDHNGRRIEELGLGIDLGAQADSSQLLDAVRRLQEPATYAATRKRLQELPRNGLEEAARWLEKRLERQLTEGRQHP
ncbi:MAG: glycosyltransferase [Acidobacteriota bacterium]|nr:glycosyltransferase [Acidobacteriota bacterium]